ncbi:MAG: hypothetical protein DMF84_16000 [Acidobacteria bacterium]|nr:MAG: hypothetical protein DMF84_16000 [Acidobacteriota bacterium]
MKAVAEICREALASRDRMSGTAGRIVVTVVVVLAIVIARIRRIEAGVIRPLMISGGIRRVGANGRIVGQGVVI